MTDNAAPGVDLPVPCLVVLVGPSGAGKTTWAHEQFRDDQVVTVDSLRALVGTGERDQRAGTDAFDVLDLVLERRLRRGLVTVIDSLGLDPARRRRWLAAATARSVPCHVVVFDTPAAECRARNRARGNPVPAKVVSDQLHRMEEQRPAIIGEGFAGVHAPGRVRVVPPDMVGARERAALQREDPMTLRFGLQIPAFDWSGGAAELRPRLIAIAQAAEGAGFDAIWVMDHFLQIPQVGREWDPMLESYTTLGFLAGVTERVRLGTLVTGVTYRNVAHLGKAVATLDALSGGRAVCGLGAAWFEREHRAYGWRFPPLAERFELLEDALELLPLLWGPGSPSFSGRRITVPDATCYPRPLQERVPILVGGSGERRTLRLVAAYADACNLFGDATTVVQKVDVLRKHCSDVGRDPAEIEVTHLSSVLVGRDADEVDSLVGRLAPSGTTPESFAARAGAGTAEQHIGRFRALAEAGVQTAMVSLGDLDHATPVDRFAEVIAAFR